MVNYSVDLIMECLRERKISCLFIQKKHIMYAEIETVVY